MSLNKIEILNPIPGGMQFTSADRARSFCRRGLAEMHGARLYFFTDTQEHRSEEQEFLRNRGGVLYWNGDSKDLFAMFKPGEVRS